MLPFFKYYLIIGQIPAAMVRTGQMVNCVSFFISPFILLFIQYFSVLLKAPIISKKETSSPYFELDCANKEDASRKSEGTNLGSFIEIINMKIGRVPKSWAYINILLLWSLKLWCLQGYFGIALMVLIYFCRELDIWYVNQKFILISFIFHSFVKGARRKLFIFFIETEDVVAIYRVYIKGGIFVSYQTPVHLTCPWFVCKRFSVMFLCLRLFLYLREGICF